MGRALLIGSTNFNVDNGFVGNANTSAAAAGTENTIQTTGSIAGVLSQLAVLADATGSTRAVTSRVNGAAGNQSVSPTNTTAGLYQDTTHSDTISAGNSFNIRVTTGSGTPVYQWYRMVFAATSGHGTFFRSTASGGANNVGPGLTLFPAFAGTSGSHSNATSESAAQITLRAAGAMQNLQLRCSSNTLTAASTLITRVNGADGAQSVTIGAGLTGIFQDTVNTDAVASGDRFNLKLTTGATGTALNISGACGVDFTSLVAVNDVLAANTNSGTARAASGTASFYVMAGSINVKASEALAKVQHGFAVATSNLRIGLSANTYSSGATFSINKNGAAGNQTVAIGAGLTGTFEDTSNADGFYDIDDADVQIVGGTSGSITIRWFGLTEAEQTAQGFEAVVPILTRKPLPSSLQQFEAWPRQGTINSLTPQGFHPEFPVRFARKFPAHEQQFVVYPEARGNVPSPVTPQGWHAVFPERIARPFKAALQQYDLPVLGAYSSVVVAVYSGWQWVAPDFLPRRPMAAIGWTIPAITAQATPSGWTVTLPEAGRPARRPAGSETAPTPPAAAPQGWGMAWPDARSKAAARPAGAETMPVPSARTATAFDSGWDAPARRPRAKPPDTIIWPPEKVIFATPGNTALWDDIGVRFRRIVPPPPDFFRLFKTFPRIASQPNLLGVSANPTLLGVSTNPTLLGQSTDPTLIGEV